MQSLTKLMAASAMGAALSLFGSLAAGAVDADHKAEWSKINILFIPWSQSSNAFFEAVVNGAKDAAAQQGVKLDIQFGEENQEREKTILETGIANKVSGIAINIADDNAYKDDMCKAMADGIPVVTFNIDDLRHGAPGSSCRMAFMGQNFIAAGYVLGKRMIAEGHLKKGDKVFTPVEAPEATYAVQRHEGVQKALSEIGATSEMLGTGNDHAQALNMMTQYLIGHPKTAAVVGLGQTPTSQAAQAIHDAGLKNSRRRIRRLEGNPGRHQERSPDRHRRPAALLPGLLRGDSARPQPQVRPLSLRDGHRRDRLDRQNQL